MGATATQAAPRRRLLLVDDEPNVLLGLRRTLHGLRAQWDIAQAGSGDEALEILDSQTVDVLLCDLHMPGVDGRQVLTHAWEVQPTTVRILFSGGAHEDLVLASTGHAHQFLLKPSQPDELIARLRRLAELRGLLASEELLRVVSRFGDLPVLPDLYPRLQHELNAPGGSAASVGAILAEDPGMSLRLLRVANSTLLASGREVCSTAGAAKLLGLDLVRALVLAADLFDACAPQPPLEIEDLWLHSMQVAECARALARHEGLEQQLCELAFLAGSLHEVGEIVLRTGIGAEYLALVQQGRSSRSPLCVIEQERLAVTHAQVGAYLLCLWGMPQAVVQAVAASHGPRGAAESRPMPLLVHVADVLVSESRPRSTGPHVLLDEEWLELGGCAGKLPAWREVCHGVLDRQAP